MSLNWTRAYRHPQGQKMPVPSQPKGGTVRTPGRGLCLKGGGTSHVGVAVGRWLRFVDEAGDSSADDKVVDLAERVEADVSGPVDDHQARGASQLVSAHRDGKGGPVVVGVDADREGDAVLVKECFE